MTNTEILNSWREPIENAVLETFHRFKAEPKVILTESDLKCNLYMDLIKQKPYVQYAVHTEVTHYTGEIAQNGNTKYRFRDMSLLCPWRLKENDEIWDKEVTYLKGFKHVGPAFHLELKVARQCRNENEVSKISAQDITNLNDLTISKGREKRYAIVWGSRDKGYKVEEMESDARDELYLLKNELKELVDIYLFDRNNCKKIFFDETWKTIDLEQ